MFSRYNFVYRSYIFTSFMIRSSSETATEIGLSAQAEVWFCCRIRFANGVSEPL